MSPELKLAREKQLVKGNSPHQTRPTQEQWDDFGGHCTGLRYRKSLEMQGHSKLCPSAGK